MKEKNKRKKNERKGAIYNMCMCVCKCHSGIYYECGVGMLRIFKYLCGRCQTA